MELLKNGTKKAATIADAYLREHKGQMTQEEAHAIRLLIAAAVKNPDEEPPIWHCDTYCRNVRHITCQGEMCKDPCAEDLCPYYDEMLY